MKIYKIIVCGGHTATSLAIIEELKKRPNYNLIYVGRKKALDKDINPSWEYRQIEKMGLKFYDLPAGKLKRNIGFGAVVSLLKIPGGFFRAFFILKKEKPDIIVSFGGFVALPVALAGKLFNIPVITHEQTTVVGLTNKIIAQLAATFCVSWPQTVLDVKHKNIILTGNPMRKAIRSSDSSLFTKIDRNLPLIYVTGGSLGSHFINMLVDQTLESLLNETTMIHQSGDAAEYDDYAVLNNRRENLTSELKSRYLIFKHIDGSDLGWIYKNADILIGRSGANTITETLAFKLPAIFIPLPIAGGGEQLKNAQMLSSLGVAEIIEQKNLNPQKFIELVKKMIKNKSFYQNHFNKETEKLLVQDAAPRIVQEIEKLMVK